MGMTEISRLLWFLRIDEDSTVRHYAAKTVSNVLGRHCETRVKYVVFDRTRTLNQNPQSIITVSLTKFERQYFNYSNISLYHSRNSREYFNPSHPSNIITVSLTIIVEILKLALRARNTGTRTT